jgi:hypothetical protein
MMISIVDNGKFVKWVAIVYSQLVEELIQWDKCQKNMIEKTTKREPKNDVCHYAVILEVMFHKWFPLGVKKKKRAE